MFQARLHKTLEYLQTRKFITARIRRNFRLSRALALTDDIDSAYNAMYDANSLKGRNEKVMLLP